MKTPDRRAVLRIKLENLLSFGPDSPELELENLNILIGPNASGKSNLIEALSLLRATPMPPASNVDIRSVLRDGGGTDEWIWKGGSGKTASIDVLIRSPQNGEPLRHFLAFSADNQGFRFREERIENGGLLSQSVDNSVTGGASALSVYRDPDRYPQFLYLTEFYEKIRIYREWQFGRKAGFRVPQRADMRNDFLDERFSNLALFLSRLRRKPKARGAITDGLKDLYDGFTDFDVVTEGGSVQVFFTEGDFSLPATRLSDGTLHYLCLLAILCDPDPPPLICIEEPELGLHPDILPKLADLLVQASERTQLIVTTHSDVLVDAMTDRPDAVVICEKHEGQTHMRRLSKAELAPWLEKYRLGELWSRGHIGANRW